MNRRGLWYSGVRAVFGMSGARRRLGTAQVGRKTDRSRAPLPLASFGRLDRSCAGWPNTFAHRFGEIVLAIGRRIDLGAAGLFFLHSRQDCHCCHGRRADLPRLHRPHLSRGYHMTRLGGDQVVSAAARRKSQTTIRSWLAFGARSDHIAGSPIVYWIGVADCGFWNWTHGSSRPVHHCGLSVDRIGHARRIARMTCCAI